MRYREKTLSMRYGVKPAIFPDLAKSGHQLRPCYTLVSDRVVSDVQLGVGFRAGISRPEICAGRLSVGRLRDASGAKHARRCVVASMLRWE